MLETSFLQQMHPKRCRSGVGNNGKVASVPLEKKTYIF